MLLVAFEAVTAMIVQNTLLWILRPYNLERTWHFGGAYRLYLQGRNGSKARNQSKRAARRVS
jgi:hypothetical protein